MSNLLKDASILLTPTGYDNGSMNAIKPENGDGDFTFSRNSAATRVNAQGLVENVQIISPELVSNGDFSQIGTEEVLNGNFSQEGSELVTNGDFSNGLANWVVDDGTSWTNVNDTAFCDGNNGLIRQNITSTQNKVYKVTFDTIATNSSGKELGVRIDAGTYAWNSYSTGTHTIYLTAGSNGFEGVLFYATGGWTGSIDNVSVKEVGQNWTFTNGTITDKYNASMTAYQSGVKITPFIKTGTFKVVFDLVVTSGSCKFDAGGGNDEIYTTSGTKEKIITNPTKFEFNAFNLGWVGSLDNISVKEVGQDWSFGTGWSVDQANSKAVSDTTTSNLTSSTTLISGRKYKFKLDSEAISSGSYSFLIRFNSTNTDIGVINSDGSHEFTVVADSTSFRLQTLSGGSTSFSVTNISVKEITDDTDIPRINYSGFSYQDTLGSELIAGGDFSYDSGWSGQKTIANGQLTKNSSGLVYKAILDVSVKDYKVVVDVDTKGSALTIYLGGAQQSLNVGVNTIDMQSGGSNSFVGFNNGDGSVINSISVKEVTGQEVVPDSGCGSWLLEPQSTNLVNNSELLNTYFSYKVDTTITDNYGTSPSGEANSSRIQFVDDTSFCYSVISVSTDHTSSVFVKGVSGETVRFGIGSSVVTGDLFTFNGLWQRIDFTASSATQIFFSSYGGATTRDFEAFGLQLEALSYATSYIPTNGATSTRLQDIANNSGNSTLINSTEGVLYAEIAALANDGTSRQISISDSSYTNTVLLRYLDLSNTLQGVFRVGGAFKGSCNFTLSNPIDSIKVAYKYKNSDFALWVNGAEVSTSTDSFSISANTLNELSFDRGDGTQYFYGKNKALAVYKEALTDAQLQSLTTI